MGDEHLSREMLADLLSGRLEDDDLQARVIPHLLDRCPTCRRRVAAIRRLQERLDHWDAGVVVREGREAPRLLETLVSEEVDRGLARLEEDESFHTWALAQALIEESRRRVFTDPHRAVELAEMAVAATGHLPGEAYHPDWVGDLTARAWAYLGNAHRVLGELRAAEADFRRARHLLATRSTGRPEVAAEILDLEASLRREQRRLPEALALLDRALALYRQIGDEHRVGRALVKKAKTFEEAGEVEAAIELLRQVPGMLDPQREPHLLGYARHNLLYCLIIAERFAEARELLPEMRQLSASPDNSLDHARLRWAEGRIAAGLGEPEAAEAAYREAQEHFLEHDIALDAARVSLDLALAYTEQGRTEDLKNLAGRLPPLFYSRDLHREALAALYLFQRAVEKEVVTIELIRELAELVRRRP